MQSNTDPTSRAAFRTGCGATWLALDGGADIDAIVTAMAEPIGSAIAVGAPPAAFSVDRPELLPMWVWASMSRVPAVVPAVRGLAVGPGVPIIVVVVAETVELDAVTLAWQAGADGVARLADLVADPRRAIDRFAWLGNDPSTLAPLPIAVRDGLELFSRGAYYEAHHLLEAAWRATPGAVRRLYQGILQVGIGYYHMARDNRHGARKMLSTGMLRLRQFWPEAQGIPVAALLSAAEAVAHPLRGNPA